MLLFWILAALISVGAATLIMVRAAAAERRTGPADPTLEVYRRQLTEIDDLAERGLLGPDERTAAHAEAGRRILGQSRRPEPDVRPISSTATRRIVLVAAGLAPVLALLIYLFAGRPGYPDQPYKARLKAWEQTALTDYSRLDPTQLAAVLEDSVAKRPDDPRGLLLLGNIQSKTGDPISAIRNLRKAASLAPDKADVWTALGEALTRSGTDEDSNEATQAFRRANALDPAAPEPRYFIARADIVAGQTAEGLAIWRSLAAGIPATDPSRAALQAAIDETTRTGRLPAPRAAPTDPEASDQQAAFIQAMVARQAAKLKAHPDDPAGWALLIHSYGVLGKDDLRRAAIAEARRLFKDRPADLKTALPDGA